MYTFNVQPSHNTMNNYYQILETGEFVVIHHKYLYSSITYTDLCANKLHNQTFEIEAEVAQLNFAYFKGFLSIYDLKVIA